MLGGILSMGASPFRDVRWYFVNGGKSIVGMFGGILSMGASPF